MSMDHFSTLIFGTVLALVIIGGSFFFVRYVRNQFFPSDRSDKLDGAMLQMQMFQAELESRAEEGLESPGEDDGESDPTVAEEADPPERQE